jgi:septum formation protein
MSAGLVLASQSRVRAQVLTAAGVAFETASPGVDEDAVKAEMLAEGASPSQVAQALADRKALAVSRARPGLVLGADQTLDLDGRLFDKVGDLAAARERLLLLRGKPHRLHAALAAARDGVVVWRDLVSATLVMRSFSDVFLDDYLRQEGQASLSSVGCYRLEGLGVQLFSSIEGDYFAILGLPLFSLLDFLRGQREIAA